MRLWTRNEAVVDLGGGADFSDIEDVEHRQGAAHVEQEVVVLVDDMEDVKQ